MNFFVTGRLTIYRELHFLGKQLQLPMNFAPFRHPHIGQEVLVAELSKTVFSQCLPVSLEKLPEIYPCHKIRFRMAIATMCLVGSLSLVLGSLAGILNTQRTDDDQNFIRAVELRSCQDDSCQPWINRKTGHLPSRVGYFSLAINRTKLFQDFKAILDSSSLWRINKGK